MIETTNNKSNSWKINFPKKINNNYKNQSLFIIIYFLELKIYILILNYFLFSIILLLIDIFSIFFKQKKTNNNFF